jgi:hypothetical protein
MQSNGWIAEWFRALTPVALRAPSVSALNHKQPQREEVQLISQRKQAKVLTEADHYLTLRESCVASLRWA